MISTDTDKPSTDTDKPKVETVVCVRSQAKHCTSSQSFSEDYRLWLFVDVTRLVFCVVPLRAGEHYVMRRPTST